MDTPNPWTKTFAELFAKMPIDDDLALTEPKPAVYLHRCLTLKNFTYDAAAYCEHDDTGALLTLVVEAIGRPAQLVLSAADVEAIQRLLADQ